MEESRLWAQYKISISKCVIQVQKKPIIKKKKKKKETKKKE